MIADKDVWVIQTGIDKYNRILGHVFALESDAGVQMVWQGGAWAYRFYNPSKEILTAEKEARSEKRGLWALPKKERIAPWEWRHNKKTQD